ncbi:MAG: phytanoyl-CoA dioxygenase family protein [Chitinophagales bacterium]
MKEILTDKLNVTSFNKNGFLCLPFLNKEQVRQLNTLANSIPIPEKTYFYSTSFLEDIDFKKQLSQQIIEIVFPQLNSTFKEFKLLGGNFLYKLPGDESQMGIHQDWTVVDEKEYQSITVWIPLCDTNEENGAIQCIPGSHQWTEALRAPSLPIAHSEVYSELVHHLELQPQAAGEAFIFNHALLHASPPNLSSTPRIAVTIGLVHATADLMMYYKSKDGTVDQYSMPDDMFLHFPNIKPEPKIGKLIDNFTYEVPVLDNKLVQAKLYKYRQSNFTMKPMFKDVERQTLFEQQGYLKTPVLDQIQVDQLLDLYRTLEWKDTGGNGFYDAMNHSNKEMVGNVMERIIEIAMPSIQQYMHELQVFRAGFVVKEPNPKGVVTPHQNWSSVEDEKEHCSLTCWIPLQDVNMDNGCLGVIEGSHRFFNHVRPSPSPQVPSPLSKHMFSIFPYLKLMEMRAGEALLFDDRTIHASPPNITDQPRIGIELAFTQKEAQISHYYMKPGTKNRILQYEIDSTFFKKYDNSTLSGMYDKGELINDYQLVAEMDYKFEEVDTEEMNRRIMEAGNEMNTSLVLRMTELFKDEMEHKPKGESQSQKREPELTAFQQSFVYRLRPSNLISAFKWYILHKRA